MVPATHILHHPISINTQTVCDCHIDLKKCPYFSLSFLQIKFYLIQFPDLSLTLKKKIFPDLSHTSGNPAGVNVQLYTPRKSLDENDTLQFIWHNIHVP